VERAAFVERLRLRVALHESGAAAPDAAERATPAAATPKRAPAPLASAPTAAPTSAPTALTPTAAAALAPAADTRALFVERLHELGVTVAEVASLAEARQGLEGLVAQRGSTTVACAADLRWEGIAARHTLEAGEASFGLCRADWAVAETGSVVVRSSVAVRRGYSLVPPAVGFFVPASRLVPTIGDVLRALPTDGLALPSCVSFISGPSSTSDLAAIHVVGVHGPGEVFVWMIAEE
jgi:L-lactate utilization protein LutC